MYDLQVFSLDASREFGERVARSLGVALARHEEREFEDGEHKVRPLENVRGRDVYVVQSLYGGGAGGSANDKLVRLLFFIGALKDASAARVTALAPYLCYARKDRRTKPRDPVSTRYVAELFEAVGTDRVVTLDVHNLAAFENAFRIPTDHLEAKALFVEHFAARVGDAAVVVVSPDVGGVKRAEAFRDALEARLGRPAGSAFVEKHRSEGVLSGGALVGDVSGRTVILLDDLISSGGTLARAAAACRDFGAAKLYAAATHGLFMAGAERLFAEPGLEQVVVANSVPPFRLGADTVTAKLEVVDVAPLFAEAIRRIHAGGSIVNLLGG